MQFTSVGDIAHSFLMRGQNTRLKAEMMRLSQSLASGKHANMSEHLRGEFTSLSAIERSMTALGAHRTAARETVTLLETAQLSLGTVQDIAATMAPALLSAGNSGHPALLRSTAADAVQKFDSIVAALNVRIADRAVFSGRATDRSALVGAPQMLAALKAEIAGATSADDMVTRIKAWFETPGGPFETGAYTGSASPLSPIQVSETEAVAFATTALTPEIRDTLAAFAMAALASDAPGGVNAAHVVQRAGTLMLTSQSELAILRADIGSLQAYAETASARTEAALAATEIARTAIYEADPYRAASELELAQTQLEAVYTLTARISRLSLSDFLR